MVAGLRGKELELEGEVSFAVIADLSVGVVDVDELLGTAELIERPGVLPMVILRPGATGNLALLPPASCLRPALTAQTPSGV